jgi:hypothetical protein
VAVLLQWELAENLQCPSLPTLSLDVLWNRRSINAVPLSLSLEADHEQDARDAFNPNAHGRCTRGASPPRSASSIASCDWGDRCGHEVRSEPHAALACNWSARSAIDAAALPSRLATVVPGARLRASTPAPAFARVSPGLTRRDFDCAPGTKFEPAARSFGLAPRRQRHLVCSSVPSEPRHTRAMRRSVEGRTFHARSRGAGRVGKTPLAPVRRVP